MGKTLDKTKDQIIDNRQVFFALDLFSFFLCLSLSRDIFRNPVYGAALFICGISLETYAFLHSHRAVNSNTISLIMSFAVFCMFAAAAALFFLYPKRIGNLGGTAIGIFIVLLFIRSSTTKWIIQRYILLRIRIRWILITNIANSLLQYCILRWFISRAFAVKICLIAFLYTVAILLWLLFSRGRQLTYQADFRLSQVSSYALYSSMLFCSNVSFYLSVMNYINSLFIYNRNLYFFPLALWLVLVLVCVLILGSTIRRGVLKKVEKSSLFFAGGLFWIVSYFVLRKDYVLGNPSLVLLWNFFKAIGLALMLLLCTYMQEDMKLVLALTDDIGENAVKTNRFLIQQSAFLIAGVVIFFELIIFNFAIEGRIPLFGHVATLPGTYTSVLNVLSLVFVLLSMFFALVQPVNRDVSNKLRLYREQKLSHSVNPALEGKLQKILIKKYRARVGVKIIAFFLRPLFYHKVINAKCVDQSKGPVVFVANHRELYGPIAINLYLPFSFRPWIDHNMLEKESIALHVWEGTFQRIKPVWLAKALLLLVRPLILWALNSVEPIPVYRQTRRIVETIRTTVNALSEQDNILIFPENPMTTENGRYALYGVSQFYTGFVTVAKAYYKRTGKAVTFYPVYANAKKRTITFGDGIAYDPEGVDEPTRICDRLIRAINGMAVE